MLAFLYYLVGIDVIRGGFYLGILGISFAAILYSSQQADGIKVNLGPVTFFYVLLIVGFIIEILNGIFSPFLLYILAAPSLAYFILNSRFNLKILSLPIYIISAVFFLYFLFNQTLIGVFPNISTNYVSVVMIMNVVLLNALEKRQGQKVTIHYSILALFFSVLALGRAGMICSFLLLLNAIWINWRFFSKTKKIAFWFVLIAPALAIVTIQWEEIIPLLTQVEFFEKFVTRGIDSPARDILQREYWEHMNIINLFTGYNFEHNQWFIHYGLNPHNSYIRLHYYLGALFFIIVPIIIWAGVKLLKENKFIFVLFFAILLRAWTDIALFLTLYDFVLVLLVLIAFKKRQYFYPVKRRPESVK